MFKLLFTGATILALISGISTGYTDKTGDHTTFCLVKPMCELLK